MGQHALLTTEEVSALPIKVTQHESFNRIVAANQYFEKLIRENNKVIQLFEKQPCGDPALLIYIAGATGTLSNFTFSLLTASQNDSAKDTIFGTAFLLLWKMVHIYGKAAVFKDINSQNFHLATWFEANFPEDRKVLTLLPELQVELEINFKRLSKTQINTEEVSMSDLEVMIQKAMDPPKKGNDHLGAPFSVMKIAPKMIELLLRAKAAGGGLDDEKMTNIIMTLRDSSRAGFITAYARKSWKMA